MKRVIVFIKILAILIVGEILFGEDVRMHERKKFWDVYKERLK